MLIKLENVKKKYKDFELNCSLTLREGYITGLIGQNGAGKSTTFKALLDLVEVDGGIIEILGKNPKELTPKDKENIGVVVSDSGFSGYFTVKDIVKVLESFYLEFDKKMFLKRCEDTHIPLDKKVKDFSTGMKAKLKVLVALSHNAKLLILDEPTAGLDVIARDEVLNILREYMEESGRGILISSHISSDLEGLCDDIYMIDNGTIVLHEDTNVLLDNYGLIKVTPKQYESLDKKYIIKTMKESYGYSCLTKEKQYYMDNYKEYAIEKGSIDNVITLMIKGE